MPQGYSRPRTRCPLASTTVLLPITAKGALSWGWAGARAHTQLVWVRGSWLERGVGTQSSVSPSSITINNLFLKGSWHHPAPPTPHSSTPTFDLSAASWGQSWCNLHPRASDRLRPCLLVMPLLTLVGAKGLPDPAPGGHLFPGLDLVITTLAAGAPEATLTLWNTEFWEPRHAQPWGHWLGLSAGDP